MPRQGSFLFRPQGSILFCPKGSVPRAPRGQTHAPFPVVRICKKYKKDKVFTVIHKDKKGKIHERKFYHDGFKRRKSEDVQCHDRLPVAYYYTPTSLIDRLKANRCELCGCENVMLEMHHIRKLKNLKGKEDWERIMIARRRKTIALCQSCHRKIHNGTLD